MQKIVLAPPAEDCPADSGQTDMQTTAKAGVELRMRMQYNANSILFLPGAFRLGPWLNVAVPTSLPPYDYSIMVEQH